MLNVLSFVRIKNFIRNCLLFSCLLLPLCAFAGPEFIIDGKTGLPVRTRSGFNVNGLKPAYSAATKSFYYEHSAAHDLSTLRSVMTGARATARVPAVVRRSVPALRVAARLSSKLRYAKFTPQSLIAGLILDAALQKLLEDEGYVYDEQQQDFVDGNEYVIQLWDRDENNKMRIYAQRGLSKEAVAMGEERYARVYVEEMCRNTWNNKLPGTEKYEYWNSRGYKYSHVDIGSGNCVIAKDGDTRYVIGYRVVPNTKRPITDSQLQEVLVKYIENHPNPEKILEAAEMPESAWGAPKVLITQETIVNSEPYTDSRDGKAKQSQFRLWPCGGETCATETIKDRPDLKPNSPEAPAATPGGNAGTGSGGQSGNQSGNGDKDQTEQQKPFDLCREHPEVMACDQQPEPEDADLTIPKETVNLDFKPENVFSTDAACPKGEEFEAFGGRFSISLEPACAAARKIRPFIIVGAWLVAAFFVARVVRQEV